MLQFWFWSCEIIQDTCIYQITDVCMEACQIILKYSRQCIFRSEPLTSYPGSFSWPHMQKDEMSLAGYEANMNFCVLQLGTYYSSLHPHTHIHAHLHIWCTLLAHSCILTHSMRIYTIAHSCIHTCTFDAPKQIIYGIALSPGNCLSAPFVMMHFCTSHKRSLVNSRTVLHV